MSEPLQFMAPFTIGAQLEARAAHEICGRKVFLIQDDRTWTYRQLRDEAVRIAHFLRGRLEPVGGRPRPRGDVAREPPRAAGALGGCAYAGLTLFGVNTGLRGETLAGVVNQSRARLLVVDERLLPRGRARARPR